MGNIKGLNIIVRKDKWEKVKITDFIKRYILHITKYIGKNGNFINKCRYPRKTVCSGFSQPYQPKK